MCSLWYAPSHCMRTCPRNHYQIFVYDTKKIRNDHLPPPTSLSENLQNLIQSVRARLTKVRVDTVSLSSTIAKNLVWAKKQKASKAFPYLLEFQWAARKQQNLEETFLLIERGGVRKSDGEFLHVGRSSQRLVDRLTSSLLLIWEPTSQILCTLIDEL